MKNLLKLISGDKFILALVVLLGLVSFLPVYSASTNLVYVGHNGSTFGHLFKHMCMFGLGLFVLLVVHKIPYKFFGGLSKLMMLLISFLLAYTLIMGWNSNFASRWVGGIQPSLLAFVVVMIYTARFLTKFKDSLNDFWLGFRYLWIPVGIVILLIFKENLSTAVIIFSAVSVLMLIGKYPFRHFLKIAGAAVFLLAIFILVMKAYPNMVKNRVDTWESRIYGKNNQQSEKAKMAIATGKFWGFGVGKSIQRNFLPQSSSDFIFAITVEEFGFIGAFIIVLLYFILFVRILLVAYKARTLFSTLLVVGLSLPIIFQALINMIVAVGIGPVTGQPLPLISSGGTSVVATCFSIGIILNVSKHNKESIVTDTNENELMELNEIIETKEGDKDEEIA